MTIGKNSLYKDMKETKFKHTLPIQLRFNDIDKFGHVNNAIFFTFFDLGKTEYFNYVCPHIDWDIDGIVVAHIEVDFLSQIFSEDKIAVQTKVSRIGNKSFDLFQQIIDLTTKEIKCVCHSVMVAYDVKKHQSKELQEDWKKAITLFEEEELI